MRAIILRFHRYVGLALAAILILMGASGALLAFYDDIDGFLNAGMYVVPPGPRAEPLPPLLLRKRLEEQIPGVHAHNVPLSFHPGRAAVFPVTSTEGTPSGRHAHRMARGPALRLDLGTPAPGLRQPLWPPRDRPQRDGRNPLVAQVSATRLNQACRSRVMCSHRRDGKVTCRDLGSTNHPRNLMNALGRRRGEQGFN